MYNLYKSGSEVSIMQKESNENDSFAEEHSVDEAPTTRTAIAKPKRSPSSVRRITRRTKIESGTSSSAQQLEKIAAVHGVKKQVSFKAEPTTVVFEADPLSTSKKSPEAKPGTIPAQEATATFASPGIVSTASADYTVCMTPETDGDSSNGTPTSPGAVRVRGIGSFAPLSPDDPHLLPEDDFSQHPDSLVSQSDSSSHDEERGALVEGFLVVPEVRGPIVPAIKVTSRRRLYIAMGVLVWVIGVVVSASIFLVRQKPKEVPVPETDMPSQPPTLPPSADLELDFKIQLLNLTNSTDDSKFSSPEERRALRWIALGDPLLTGLASSNLLQRFSLALFHFQAGPWRTCNPSSSTTGCLFDKIQRAQNDSLVYVQQPETRWLSVTHECEWVGITCDENRVVTKLDASECWMFNCFSLSFKPISYVSFYFTIRRGLRCFWASSNISRILDRLAIFIARSQPLYRHNSQALWHMGPSLSRHIVAEW